MKANNKGGNVDSYKALEEPNKDLMFPVDLFKS